MGYIHCPEKGYCIHSCPNHTTGTQLATVNDHNRTMLALQFEKGYNARSAILHHAVRTTSKSYLQCSVKRKRFIFLQPITIPREILSNVQKAETRLR